MLCIVQPFRFAESDGNRKTLFYCSVLCGRVETLVTQDDAQNPFEHKDYNLRPGYHSVRGEGHGFG